MAGGIAAAHAGHGVQDVLAQFGTHAAGEQQQVQVVDQGIQVAGAHQRHLRPQGGADVTRRARPADAGPGHVLGQVDPGGGGGLVDDLELGRRGAGLRQRTVRRHIARAEVAEHRRCAVGALGQAVELAHHHVVARHRAGAHGAHPVRHAQHRLPQLAEIGGRGLAGFGVEQDRPHHRTQVAAHALAVVVEHPGHPGHIGRAGVAGGEALDQLATDEGADIGMVEQRVQPHAQAVGRRGVGRDQHRAGLAREQRLLGRGALAGIGLHALQVDQLVGAHRVVGVGKAEGVGGQLRIREAPAPAGEDLGHRHHVGVVVGLDGLAVAVQARAAVLVELDQADAEQLHHLAGKVFVRQAPGGRVFLAVADVGEVDAHHRAQGDVLQQVAVVAEGLAVQGVQVIGIGPGVGVEVRIGLRHHEDLVQRPGHALAQLVLPQVGGLPEAAHHRGRVVAAAIGAVGGTLVVQLLHIVDEVVRGRQGLLLGDPGRLAHARHTLDLGGRGAEAGLLQETRGGVLARDVGIRRATRLPGHAQRGARVQLAGGRHHVQAVEGPHTGTPVHQGARRRGQQDDLPVRQVADEQVAVFPVAAEVVGEHHVHFRARLQDRGLEAVVGRHGRLDLHRADHHAVHTHHHGRPHPCHQGSTGPHRQRLVDRGRHAALARRHATRPGRIGPGARQLALRIQLPGKTQGVALARGVEAQHTAAGQGAHHGHRAAGQQQVAADAAGRVDHQVGRASQAARQRGAHIAGKTGHRQHHQRLELGRHAAGAQQEAAHPGAIGTGCQVVGARNAGHVGDARLGLPGGDVVVFTQPHERRVVERQDGVGQGARAGGGPFQVEDIVDTGLQADAIGIDVARRVDAAVDGVAGLQAHRAGLDTGHQVGRGGSAAAAFRARGEVTKHKAAHAHRRRAGQLNLAGAGVAKAQGVAAEGKLVARRSVARAQALATAEQLEGVGDHPAGDVAVDHVPGR